MDSLVPVINLLMMLTVVSVAGSFVGFTQLLWNFYVFSWIWECKKYNYPVVMGGDYWHFETVVYLLVQGRGNKKLQTVVIK